MSMPPKARAMLASCSKLISEYLRPLGESRKYMGFLGYIYIYIMHIFVIIIIITVSIYKEILWVFTRFF